MILRPECKVSIEVMNEWRTDISQDAFRWDKMNIVKIPGDDDEQIDDVLLGGNEDDDTSA